MWMCPFPKLCLWRAQMLLVTTVLLQLSLKPRMLLRHLGKEGVVGLVESTTGKWSKAIIGNCSDDIRPVAKHQRDPDGVLEPPQSLCVPIFVHGLSCWSKFHVWVLFCDSKSQAGCFAIAWAAQRRVSLSLLVSLPLSQCHSQAVLWQQQRGRALVLGEILTAPWCRHGLAGTCCTLQRS